MTVIRWVGVFFFLALAAFAFAAESVLAWLSDRAGNAVELFMWWAAGALP